ncbi:lipid A biosynthesis acyltransferase [bacterium endosymbiont of Escarpia laminata]|nr:MAG: lipid A biosynthesis acyltransferase [bacterium endosymbiont of Escarpia laminata]
MSRHWLKQSERGSLFLIRLITRITLLLGRPAGRLLLYPITLYFVLFSRKARNASRNYLKRVLPQPIGLRHIFRHYHTFAATILDRIYLLSGRQDYFNIDIRGETRLLEQLKDGRGCMLLGSHLGSFELLRSLAATHPDISVKALMYEENAEKINQVIQALNPEIADMIIPIGRPDSLFEVQEAVERGEVIGILGDRIALDDKQVKVRFFDQTCRFPAGPMLIAGLLKIPVVLFFGIHQGGRDYTIHFELLTEGFHLDREERWQQITEWTQRYANRLEHHTRQAPYNWFNFYDFWDETGNTPK